VTAVGLLIRIALGLSGSDVLVGLDAEVVDLLADEGGHGFGVEGKGRGRVVGGAGAVEDEGVSIARVGEGGTTAESSTGVHLSPAPLISQCKIDGGDGGIVKGGIGRGDLSGDRSCDKRDSEEGVGEHLEDWSFCGWYRELCEGVRV